jgi:hypothetical protein
MGGEMWSEWVIGKKTIGKEPLGKPRRSLVNINKTNLLGIVLGDLDWIDLAQDRYSWRGLVNMIMNLGFP